MESREGHENAEIGDLLEDGNRLRKQPVHEKINRLIRQRITRGKYPPGSKIPTEAEIIMEFGVSRMTVRRALQDLINDRVLVGRRGSGTYVNDSAAALALSVLFVHASESEISYPYSSRLIEGFRQYGQNTFPPFRIELAQMPSLSEQSPDDTTIQELVSFQSFDGVVTMPRIRREVVEGLLDMGVPVVMIGGADWYDAPPGMAVVDSGPEKPVDYVVRVLEVMGYRKVGVIGVENDGQFTLRRITEAFRSSDLIFDSMYYEAAQWGINAGSSAMERLLDRGSDMEVVLAADDLLALGALHTLWKRGISVPDQISVLGVGNLLGEHSHSGLSTIDVRLKELGMLAAQTIHRMTAGQEVKMNNALPPRILKRASTRG